MGVFERLLGLGPLECSEALLICQHVVFSIFNGGVGLIYLKVITFVAYLGR
jgi:hypothetical protein